MPPTTFAALTDPARRANLASLASGEEGPGAWVFSRNGTGDLFHTSSCYGSTCWSVRTTISTDDQGPDEAELPWDHGVGTAP
jgi:hypothetical protein